MTDKENKDIAELVETLTLPPLTEQTDKKTAPDLDLILDIQVNLSVELGRTKMKIEEVLQLTSGSVIELDTLEGEPVNIFANQALIAKGEVVVVNDHLGVRISEIIGKVDRVQHMNHTDED